MCYDKMRLRGLYLSLLFLLLISGCVVGPDYVRPELDMPDKWQQESTKGLSQGQADLQQWWTVLNDPVLNELIEKAEQTNLDIKSAYANILRSRARLGVASGRYYPQIDATGSYTRRRNSENGLTPPLGDQTNLHSAGLEASWEIDLFGQISRSVESARGLFEASIENYRDVLVSLYAEVASNYIQLRSIQKRLEYAQANIKIQQDTLQLTKNKLEAELVPELDVSQAQLNLANTESTIPTLRIFETQAINRLGVLLGQHPGKLREKLSNDTPQAQLPAEVITSLPTELLRQRPDIRNAERRLAAQTARIGVATADLYPAFSLTGFFAMEGIQFGDLGRSASRAYGISPSVRWRIFDGNRIKSDIQAQEAFTKQLYFQYEKTVLQGLEEVENSLVGYVQEIDRRDALARSVDASKRSAELVEIRYDNGLTDFQNVLDMQRALTTQQDALAQSQGQIFQNLIGLYKAMGGGWPVENNQTDDDLVVKDASSK